MLWLLPCVWLAAVAASPAAGSAAGSAPQLVPLWSIGQVDRDNREFALAPHDYHAFRRDGFFIVGRSDPSRDWPFVQPGPADGWAGNRSHTFRIVFGLKAAPTAPGRLVLDLVDTHGTLPPRLRVAINDHVTEHDLPPGGGDASIYGDVAAGRPHRLVVPVPPTAWRAGMNTIALTTLTGSWVLFDAVALEAPPNTEPEAPMGTVVTATTAPAALVRRQGELRQVVRLDVQHLGAADQAVVRVGRHTEPVALTPGEQAVEVAVPPVTEPTPSAVRMVVAGRTVAEAEVTLRPVRRWEIYLLPHSHVDIGYTDLQTNVERHQWRFIDEALAQAEQTADLPTEARAKWNVEVLWAVESYLKQATAEQQAAFAQAVRDGSIGLDALYGNELSALCRPEELMRLVRYATRLREDLDVPLDTAMISDVPGHTWGLVPALAQAGVRYLTSGPNGGARIGFTLEAWADRPFWWESPSGREKVMVWIPRGGYWRAFEPGTPLFRYLDSLADRGYPYDLVQMRYCLGDNAGPDPNLPEMVRAWNEQYAYPKVIIATSGEMFHAMEQRHGDDLPRFRGDFTPYWEDGAASSARETALTRAAAERLSQAEALWAMLNPTGYPAERFNLAWRAAVLYNEHTWGAHNSVSEPDAPFVRDQWRIKQAFAEEADTRSRSLLAFGAQRPPVGAVAAVDVFNTTGWARSDLAVVPAALAARGHDRVLDSAGRAVPSQRLSSGELVFWAADVPPFAGRRYRFSDGPAGAPPAAATADGATLRNGRLTVQLDPRTGDIISLRTADGVEWVDTAEGGALNAYRYVPGTDPNQAQPSGAATISVLEPGPLVAALRVESTAPGCRRLVREVRLVADSGAIELANLVDKEAVRDKEGVHFAFPFAVPGGLVHLDTPWAPVQVDRDQLPGACKNWFTVQRWVDVSNRERGVIWMPLDAPLVELGGITAETPWLRRLAPTQTVYSYVMNNYWFTNYRAEQAGEVLFRYRVQPHRGGYDPTAATQAGVAAGQPLLVLPAGHALPTEPLVRVDNPAVQIATLKPADDGQGWIVRLFGTSGEVERATLHWSRPVRQWHSDLSEARGEALDGPVTVVGHQVVTVRGEERGAEANG